MLPHQLYDVKYFGRASYLVYLYEHPHYFKAYRYNQKKILLHFASMRYYADYLRDRGYEVKYVTMGRSLPRGHYYVFDPIDRVSLPDEHTILESPNFLWSTDMIDRYRAKTDKFFFNAFYMWGKRECGILPGVKSQDKHNRKRLPKGEVSPPPPKLGKHDLRYIEENKGRVKRVNGYGDCEDFMFPVTHRTARRWLKRFITERLSKFGDYQDFIDREQPFLYHSLLSTSLNIGLLQPVEVLEAIETHSDGSVPLHCLEGFIRQLFWREYQRYCYLHFDFDQNYFGGTKRLSKRWYEGTLGVPPVDDAIRFGFKTGYLHHIHRLMVIGNYMMLNHIHPKEGFRWFMEFSCDSYEWVMHQNVYEMVFFVSGGGTMRRPYISSSNYIVRMSNYRCAEQEGWCEEWDQLYQDFIRRHRRKLHRFRYYFRSSM